MGAAPGTKRRIAVAPRRRRRRVDTRAANKAIAAARNLANQDFVEKYIQPCDATWPRWTHRKTRAQYVTSLRSPEDMQDAELEACFGLVERTSSHDYRRAAGGWHPEAKRAEMRSPGLRYILVRGGAAAAAAAGVTASDEPATENSGGDGEICAFTSFMPTWEDNKPVVYCYEIHLLPELEGTGLGRLLMSHVTTAADRIGALHKTMLTCFTANTRARRFYEKLGFAVDDSSPRPRRLRDKVVEPEYVILYRPTRSDDDADADVDVDVDAAAADEGDERQEKRAKRVD